MCQGLSSCLVLSLCFTEPKLWMSYESYHLASPEESKNFDPGSKQKTTHPQNRIDVVENVFSFTEMAPIACKTDVLNTLVPAFACLFNCASQK